MLPADAHPGHAGGQWVANKCNQMPGLLGAHATLVAGAGAGRGAGLGSNGGEAGSSANEWAEQDPAWASNSFELYVRVLAVSTDLAEGRGERGVPFLLQIDTFSILPAPAQAPSAYATHGRQLSNMKAPQGGAFDAANPPPPPPALLEEHHLHSVACQIKVPPSLPLLFPLSRSHWRPLLASFHSSLSLCMPFSFALVFSIYHLLYVILISAYEFLNFLEISAFEFT